MDEDEGFVVSWFDIAYFSPTQPCELQDGGFQRRMDLSERRRGLTAEIHSVESDILKLQELKRTLNAELRDVTLELDDLARRRIAAPTTADLYGQSRVGKGSSLLQSNGKPGANMGQNPATINYFSQFDWSGELKKRMKQVFGFNEFRLCQEGVSNASMDGRDCVAVMPTGEQRLSRWPSN
jgi:ATP-dependent DNA helicase Q1